MLAENLLNSKPAELYLGRIQKLFNEWEYLIENKVEQTIDWNSWWNYS